MTRGDTLTSLMKVDSNTISQHHKTIRNRPSIEPLKDIDKGILIVRSLRYNIDGLVKLINTSFDSLAMIVINSEIVFLALTDVVGITNF